MQGPILEIEGMQREQGIHENTFRYRGIQLGYREAYLFINIPEYFK